MHYQDGALVFSPSVLMLFMVSPFASWVERLTLENPDHGIARDRRLPLLKTLAKRVLQQEKTYLENLGLEGLGITAIDYSDPQSAVTATLDAMQAGAAVIFQVRLERLDTNQRRVHFIKADDTVLAARPRDDRRKAMRRVVLQRFYRRGLE